MKPGEERANVAATVFAYSHPGNMEEVFKLAYRGYLIRPGLPSGIVCDFCAWAGIWSSGNSIGPRLSVSAVLGGLYPKCGPGREP